MLCTQQAEIFLSACGAACFFPLSAVLLLSACLQLDCVLKKKKKISLPPVNEESVGTCMCHQLLNLQRKMLGEIELYKMCTDHPAV